MKNILIKISKILGSKKFFGVLFLFLTIFNIFFTSQVSALSTESKINIIKAQSISPVLGAIVTGKEIVGDWLMSKIIKGASSIAYGIAYLCGQIIQLESKLIAWVVDISQFTTLGVVQQGWKICRDFANLFFIAILIYIAFSLILKLQKGDPKKLLFKVIAMAIIINFSLMIGGIIIDFSQVLFKYFIFAGLQEKNGFSFSQQLASSLKLQTFWSSDSNGVLAEGQKNADSSDKDDLLNVFVKLLFIIIFSFLVAIVFGAIVFTLFIRNFWLWILLILSPLAWFFGMVPVGILSKYASQWWNNFLKWCFMAPIMGFFVFLSMNLLLNQQSSINSSGGLIDQEKLKTQMGKDTAIFSFDKSKDNIFNPTNVMQLMIVLAFLVGGLMAGQSLGSGAAKGAMGMVDKAQKGARNWAKRKTMQSAPVRGAGNALMGMRNIPLVGGAFKRAGMATQRGVAAAKGEEAKRARDRIKYMDTYQLKKNFDAFNEWEKMAAAMKIGFNNLTEKQFEEMQKIFSRKGMEKEEKDLEKAAPHFTKEFAEESQGFIKAREELSAANAALQKIAKLEQEKADYEKDYEEANQLKKDENGDFVFPDEKELEKKKQKIEATDAALKQAKLDAEPLTEKIKQSKQKFEEARALIAERFQDVDLSKLSELSNVFKNLESPQAQALIDVMAHKPIKNMAKVLSKIERKDSNGKRDFEETNKLRQGVTTSIAENLYLDGGVEAVIKLNQLDTSPGAKAGHYDFKNTVKEMKIDEEMKKKINDAAHKRKKTDEILKDIAENIEKSDEKGSDEKKEEKTEDKGDK